MKLNWKKLLYFIWNKQMSKLKTSQGFAICFMFCIFMKALFSWKQEASEKTEISDWGHCLILIIVSSATSKHNVNPTLSAADLCVLCGKLSSNLFSNTSKLKIQFCHTHTQYFWLRQDTVDSKIFNTIFSLKCRCLYIVANMLALVNHLGIRGSGKFTAKETETQFLLNEEEMFQNIFFKKNHKVFKYLKHENNVSHGLTDFCGILKNFVARSYDSEPEFRSLNIALERN